MSIEDDQDNAFDEGRRHSEDISFVFNDAVELQDGPDAGLRGSVISVFMDERGLCYTVELSTGRDIQVAPAELRLIDP